MGMEIYLSPEMLAAKANEVRGFAAEESEIMQKLDNVVNSLNEIWKGDSQTAFVQQYESMKPTLMKFQNILETYAQAMDFTVRKMQEEDQGLASKNGSLFDGI